MLLRRSPVSRSSFKLDGDETPRTPNFVLAADCLRLGEPPRSETSAQEKETQRNPARRSS